MQASRELVVELLQPVLHASEGRVAAAGDYPVGQPSATSMRISYEHVATGRASPLPPTSPYRIIVSHSARSPGAQASLPVKKRRRLRRRCRSRCRLVESRRGAVGHGLRFPSPPSGRVEDWRAGRPRDHATFPAPSTSHAACGFPALRAPICFTSRLMGLSCWGRFRRVASHLIAVEQLQSVVQPRPTPPRPAEAFSFPSLRQMAPDLLFHPIFDVAETLARVSNREVVHPPLQHRIDQGYHPANRL